MAWVFTRQQNGPIFATDMTIVTYYRSPKRYRKAKPEQEVPLDRIVSARKPKRRHYGETRNGVPDGAQRTELIKEFMERTLRPQE
jgi:hypothetical protein